jgi:hypothetical protein
MVGAVLLTVATEGVPDNHVTVLVMFCVLLSVYVPVAISCTVVPGAMVELAGVIAIDTSAGAIVRLNEPVTVPFLALITTGPLALAVSMPPAVMSTLFGFEEIQLTALVRSCELPALKVPVAFNCSVWPTMMLALGPVT